MLYAFASSAFCTYFSLETLQFFFGEGANVFFCPRAQGILALVISAFITSYGFASAPAD